MRKERDRRGRKAGLPDSWRRQMRGWAGRGDDLAPLFGREPSLAAAVSRSLTGSTGQVKPQTG